MFTFNVSCFLLGNVSLTTCRIILKVQPLFFKVIIICSGVILEIILTMGRKSSKKSSNTNNENIEEIKELRKLDEMEITDLNNRNKALLDELEELKKSSKKTAPLAVAEDYSDSEEEVPVVKKKIPKKSGKSSNKEKSDDIELVAVKYCIKNKKSDFHYLDEKPASVNVKEIFNFDKKNVILYTYYYYF